MNPEKIIRPRLAIGALGSIALASLIAASISQEESFDQLEYTYSAESKAVLVDINNKFPGRYYGEESLLNELSEEDKMEAVRNINLAYNQLETSYRKWMNGTTETKSLVDLWMQESRWQQDANGESSDAYGIPQAILSKRNINAGYFLGYSDFKDSADTQIAWGLYYISESYKKPSLALEHWSENGWY